MQLKIKILPQKLVLKDIQHCYFILEKNNINFKDREMLNKLSNLFK